MTDIESCTNELLGLANTSQRVTELQRLKRDFIEETTMWRTNKVFFEECLKTVDELENERKGHAEELRQINQDINLLEDMLKSIQSSSMARREDLSRKARALRHEMILVNKQIEICGDSSLEALSFDEDLEAALRQLLRPIGFSLPQIPSAFLQGGLFPSFPLRFPIPPFPPPALRANHESKMKSCDACGGQIHRNAPTCPLCKSRTVSRNPKRKRKDQQN